MYFESHAHYDDKQFSEDIEELVEAMRQEQIAAIINVGADMKSSVKAVELSKKYDFMYASVGVHPHDVVKMLDSDIDILMGLAAYNKVVAIGEIGLDYHYENSPKEVQKLWFREQINLAKAMELPIIVHSREASKDTYDIIKESRAYDVGGVVHCFSGSREMAECYIHLGFYIGVGGVVTYKNAKTLKEVVKAIPLDYLLIETDAPYLAPVPNRGQRNDSRNLKYIAEEIAKIKEISVQEVIDKTYENGKKLFIK